MENQQIAELIKDLTIELDCLNFSLKETPSLELEIKTKLIKNILNKKKIGTDNAKYINLYLKTNL